MAALVMFRNDNAQFLLTVLQNGTAVDLTGAKLWFTAKRSFTDIDADALIQQTTGGGGIVVTGLGTARIIIDPARLATMSGPTSLFYDVQLLDAAGAIHTIESGTLDVRQDVTLASS